MNQLKLSFSKTFSVKLNENVLLQSLTPHLAFRDAGNTKWQFEAGTLIDDKQADGFIQTEYAFGPIHALLKCNRLAFDSWNIESELLNTGTSPVELARFHCLDGLLAAKHNFLSVSEHNEHSRLFTPETSVPSAKDFLEKQLWGKCGVVWARLDDPIHIQPNWGTSTDVGILLKGWDDQLGLVTGFTGPGVAWGEIGYGTCRPDDVPFFAAMLLDNILLAPSERKIMDMLFIRYGDWQESMNIWSHRCAEQMGAKSVRRSFAGYCSWYQKGPMVTGEDVLKATAEFADWPVPPGGRTIQIDDGFEVMPGDWQPNDRFKQIWDSLPAKIIETGSIPGSYMAPTMVFENHPIIAQHPDWIQRLSDGQPAVSFLNWKWCLSSDSCANSPGAGKTYLLDPDHPGARAFMADLIAGAVAHGWRYLKLDFTYAVSTARVAYDRKKTTFETLRGLSQLFREAAGPDAIICACIGNICRYTIGLADTVRIGGDICSGFDNVRRTLPDILLRMCTNGLWWLADPDVFFMRKENANMTNEENRLWTGTIGMLGGIFLTSDYPSQWDDDAKRFVRYFWNETVPCVPQSVRTVWSRDGMPTAIRVTLNPCAEMIALYNWNDAAHTTNITLSRLGINAAGWKRVDAAPDALEIVIEKAALTCKDQPPHSIRIIKLARANHPKVKSQSACRLCR